MQQGYKQTDLGIIPEEWDCVNIEDVATISMCKRIFADQTTETGEIPFYKIGTFGKEPDAYISRTLYDEYRHRFSFPQKGDVLISAAGTLGRTVVYDGKEAYFQDSNIVWLDINKKVLRNEYLNHYYRVIKWASSEGSTIARLYNGIIYATKIALPPLEEQNRIAEALSDVDSMISSLEKLIAKKKAVKQGTMQELLTGQKRLPGFVGKWQEKRVEDIAEVGRGRVISHNEISKNIGGKYPVYSSQTTNNGVMGYIRTYDFDGDYITWTTDGVNAGTVFHRSGKFNCTNVCGTLKCRDVNTGFVARRLGVETPNYVATNLANPKLMNDVMKRIIITLPPTIEEQTAIASILSEMDNEVEALEQKLEKTRQIKQGMMQQLLTGKIRLI